MAITRLILDLDQSAEHFTSRVRPDTASHRESIRRLGDYLHAMAGGHANGTVRVNAGATKATATITFTDQPVADEVVEVGNVVFTAKDSGASTNEWNITSGGSSAADAAGNAASVAALINNHASLSKFLTAVQVAGVVTVTCDVPGDVGNALQLSTDATNCTVSEFVTEDTGDDGTENTLDLS